MDKCGCCQVCGRTEHELCDLLPEEGRYGICGDNLVCRRKIEVRTRLKYFIYILADSKFRKQTLISALQWCQVSLG